MCLVRRWHNRSVNLSPFQSPTNSFWLLNEVHHPLYFVIVMVSVTPSGWIVRSDISPAKNVRKVEYRGNDIVKVCYCLRFSDEFRTLSSLQSDWCRGDYDELIPGFFLNGHTSQVLCHNRKSCMPSSTLDKIRTTFHIQGGILNMKLCFSLYYFRTILQTTSFSFVYSP